MSARIPWVALGCLALIAGVGFSRSKEIEGFPDYTRIEYAKPLPPPEEQIKQPPPGSINVRLGERPAVHAAPAPEEMLLPIYQRDAPNESEPSFGDMLADAPPVVSTPIAPATAEKP